MWFTLVMNRPVLPAAFRRSCPYWSFHNVENHTRPTSSETENFVITLYRY